MIKYWGLFKDLFVVLDDLKDSGWRLSEAIVKNVIILLASAVILLFGIDLGLTELEVGAMAAAVMSVVGIIIRLRSSGGVIKIKEDK